MPTLACELAYLLAGIPSSRYSCPINGRGEVIRTLDPLHPMQVRYQAALRPDANHKSIPKVICLGAEDRGFLQLPDAIGPAKVTLTVGHRERDEAPMRHPARVLEHLIPNGFAPH